MRSLVEEPEFTADRERLAPDIERWDDAIIGLEFILANSPTSCTLIPGTGAHGLQAVYAVAFDRYVRSKFLIYYTFDDERVYLRSLRPREAEATEL